MSALWIPTESEGLEMTTMTRYSAHNMRGGDHLPGWCAVCGRPYPERHHAVARSLGGGLGPLIHVCGRGNNLYDADGRLLHHGAAEAHLLWFWWHDGTDLDIAPPEPRFMLSPWVFLLLPEPCGWQDALAAPGWKPVN